jgi:voltage-gated potassium channel Kch
MPDSPEIILLIDHQILFSVTAERVEWIRSKGAAEDSIHLSSWLRDTRLMPRMPEKTDQIILPERARTDVRIKFRGVDQILRCDVLLGKYRGDGISTPFGSAKALEPLISRPLPGPLTEEAALSLVQAQMENQMRRATREERKESISAERARSMRRIQNHVETVTSSVGFRIGIFLIVLITISMFGIMLFEPGANDQFETLWDSFWYSVVTVTTVGYGDKSPITLGGKLVGLLLMGLGVVVLAAITGQIASYFVELQMRRREGQVSLKNVRNPFYHLRLASGAGKSAGRHPLGQSGNRRE